MKKIFKNIKYTVILTLGTTILFALFAINPTISTIVKLRREINDSRFVEKRLSEKIKNLSSLSSEYQNIQKDLPFILDAIPLRPEAPTLVAQIQSIANDSEVRISKLDVASINLTTQDASTSSSFAFEITGQGDYENLQKFISDLINMQRIVSVDSISITKDAETNENLEINIKGSSYFKK